MATSRIVGFDVILSLPYFVLSDKGMADVSISRVHTFRLIFGEVKVCAYRNAHNSKTLRGGVVLRSKPECDIRTPQTFNGLSLFQGSVCKRIDDVRGFRASVTIA